MSDVSAPAARVFRYEISTVCAFFYQCFDVGLMDSIRTSRNEIFVGWVATIVETQHSPVVCWVLLSRNPTYD
jgi:hypothetical protein